MPATPRPRTSDLVRDPAARFVSATAAVGSLADWTLLAVLVATVDAATSGSVWATTMVLLAKIVPAVAFAPLAARRVDGAPLDRGLRRHEAGRIAAVGMIATGAATGRLEVALVGLVCFEYCAAMLAATREAYISRHVPRRLFTGVNTVTGVLGYGFLPVGAAAVHALGVPAGWVVAAAGYVTLAVAYGHMPLQPTEVASVARTGAAGPGSRPAMSAGLLRAVTAAGLGLVPVVMLFVVAPRLAATWAGAPTATAALTGLVLVGGALGFVAANRRAPAEVGLAAAAAGLGLAAAGPWQPGLVLLGFGAGVAYLGLQTRLQHLADAPSQFATAFAVLKGCAAAATLAGPALHAAAGHTATLLGGAGVAAVALLVAGSGAALRATASLGAAAVRGTFRAIVGAAVRCAIDIRIEGQPVEGPAVVVSNHPNAVDGVLAMVADPGLRPIARWQRNRLARLGIWIGDCVVTTAGTDRAHRPAFADALSHLRAGGRIWLAPESGAHPGRELRAPRRGAVRMAHQAGVPVQPLGIVHASHPGPRLADWRPWRRPRVTLRWGPTVRTCGIIEVDADRMMSVLATASGMSWQPQPAAA